MADSSSLKLIFEALRGARRARPQAWLRVSGPDADGFLQGQCTQELRNLNPGQAVWALWLNTKGRVQAESLVLRDPAPGTWWLWSPHSEGAALRTRLEEFIIADDVTVEDLGAEGGWEELTLAGPAAAGWLRARLGAEPPAPGAWAALGGGLVFAGRRGLAQVWEWLRPVGAASGEAVGGNVAGDLLAELGELRAADLVRARLAAGVPAIPGEFGPRDLPQEAGLEEVAVSFTKGCYLGQEVMARLHAMGRVRRRLLRVAGDGHAPAAGEGLRLVGAEKRQGDLRAAVDDGHGGWIGLAMLNLLGLEGASAPDSPRAPGAPRGAALETEDGHGVRLLDTLAP